MHSILSRESCSFIVDLNVPGKENPPRTNLTAAVWMLSRDLPNEERDVGEIVEFHEDGEHYEAEIIEKYVDGTYDVFFFDDAVVVEGVMQKDLEPFKSTLSSDYFAHLPSTYLLTQ